MSEQEEVLFELRGLRAIAEKTASQVDEIRTKIIPDIRGDLRSGEEKMSAHSEAIIDFKAWREGMTKEFWKLCGSFGGLMILLVTILHFLFK